jgi:predicted RNA-binding protein YlqC (UPF0109 family)
MGAACVTERERQDLGHYLSDWLHHVIVGVPGSPVRLVQDPAAVTVAPHWDGPAALTLVVRAADRADRGRIIGRRGGVREPLEALARRHGDRHGVRVTIKVVEP